MKMLNPTPCNTEIFFLYWKRHLHDSLQAHCGVRVGLGHPSRCHLPARVLPNFRESTLGSHVPSKENTKAHLDLHMNGWPESKDSQYLEQKHLVETAFPGWVDRACVYLSPCCFLLCFLPFFLRQVRLSSAFLSYCTKGEIVRFVPGNLSLCMTTVICTHFF